MNWKTIRTMGHPIEWMYYLFLGAMFVMPMGTSPRTILGVFILAAWILSGEFIRSGATYLRQVWIYPVAAAAALAWIGLIWSPEPFGMGIRYAGKTYYWLYALAICSVLSLKRSRELLIQAFLAGLFLNAVVGFLQLANVLPTFSAWGVTKYNGFSGGYNTLSILLVLGMMSASFFFRKEGRRGLKTVYGIGIISYFFHLVILEGRGGYLTFTLLSPLVIYNIMPRRKMLIIVLVYVLALAVMFSSPVVQDRVVQAKRDLQHHFSGEAPSEWGKAYSEHLDRIYMWRWALNLFMKNPILGVGTGGYKQAILAAGGEKGIDHPHSSLLYMAVSFGILGIAVYIWLFWVLLKSGWNHRQSGMGFFILSSSLVLLVGGFTDTHILDSGGVFLLAVTTGMLSAFEKEDPIDESGC